MQRNEVSISSIDDVVMTLKLDYENAYFVTGTCVYFHLIQDELNVRNIVKTRKHV